MEVLEGMYWKITRRAKNAEEIISANVLITYPISWDKGRTWNFSSITVCRDGIPYAVSTGTTHANWKLKTGEKTLNTAVKLKAHYFKQDCPSASIFNAIPELQIFCIYLFIGIGAFPSRRIEPWLLGKKISPIPN